MKLLRRKILPLNWFSLSYVGGGLSVGLLLLASSPPGSGQTVSKDTTAPTVTTRTAVEESSSAKKGYESYRLGPGDVLDIRYYNRPQLSLEAVRIDGRGMIRMPLIEGEIKAACLTESELAGEIAKRYLKYYRNPHIDIFIKDYQAEPVAVIGAVRAPGRFRLQRQVRLLELLAFAEGPVERAGQTIQLVHASSNPVCNAPSSEISPDDISAQLISYNLNETLRGEERANPLIRPGDIITVLEAEQVYVVGNVYSPKPIPLKEPITVTRAIAMAGGTMRDSKSNRMRIIRQIPGTATQREIYVDLKAIAKQQAEDVMLQANDIVDVPTSAGKSILRGLISAIAPTVSSIPVRVIP